MQRWAIATPASMRRPARSARCSSFRRGTSATGWKTRLGRLTIGRPRGRIPRRSRQRGEHLRELERSRDFELVVAAIARRLVGPPAQELRGVTEAIALQVVVLHLAYALDAQRFPREILAGAPAAVRAGHARSFGCGSRPIAPWMILERVLPQRLQLFGKALAGFHRERGRNADVLQNALIVV